MAENNINVIIPKQESLDALVAKVTEVFAAASGLTADENNTFWLSEENNLGIRIKANGTAAVSVYVVDYIGDEWEITYVYLDQENKLSYNTSAGRTVFAFGMDKSYIGILLSCMIAKDTTGVSRILQVYNGTIRLFSPGKSRTILDGPTRRESSFEFATLTKLPAFHARATFAEVYYVLGVPSDTSFNSDSSIYINGSLYKVACYQNNSTALAFNV